jgi:hypothetical protein
MYYTSPFPAASVGRRISARQLQEDIGASSQLMQGDPFDALIHIEYCLRQALLV